MPLVAIGAFIAICAFAARATLAVAAIAVTRTLFAPLDAVCIDAGLSLRLRRSIALIPRLRHSPVSETVDCIGATFALAIGAKCVDGVDWVDCVGAFATAFSTPTALAAPTALRAL